MGVCARLLGVLCLPFLCMACSRPAAQASAPDGPALFKGHCAACHGNDGKGRVAKIDMTAASWQKAHSDDQLAQTLRNGIEAKGMPSFQSLLTDDAVKAIITDAIRRFGQGEK